MCKKLGFSVKEGAKNAINTWIQQKGKVFLRGIGEDVLKHPSFKEWHEFFISKYKPPRRDILLFHNCTWGKPYHESWIFREVERVVYESINREKVHFVVVSSAGVVPREYWDQWPFCSYDADPWLFTPEDYKTFVNVNSQRVSNYLSKYSEIYKCIVAYFPQGDCARESVKLGIEASNCILPTYFVPDIYPDQNKRDEDYYACLTYPESLEELKAILTAVRDRFESN